MWQGQFAGRKAVPAVSIEGVSVSIARSRSLQIAVASAALLGSAVTGLAQGQAEPPSVREYCIKVAPGKGAEFEAFLNEVTLPLAKSRAEAGEFSWLVVARSVVPAGSSAACDYRMAWGYKGLPPEAPSKEATVAALKRANMTITFDQMVARRNALSHLVGVNIWYGVDRIGVPAEKGYCLVLNHYKVKPGEWSEWVRLETTYWKALMDAWLKAGGKGFWGLEGLWMPTGESAPYNAQTVDIFPDWDSQVRGVPVDELWPKVHPGTTSTAVFDRLDKVRSVHDREVYKIVDVVRAK